MRTFDGGDTATPPADVIDAGDTASPPTDIVDSMFVLTPQSTAGAVTPSFAAVDSAQAIPPGPGQVLVVRVAGTSTDVTMQVPGVQPYSGVANADRVETAVVNADRVFHIADLLVDPADEVAVVTYSQTIGVESVLVKGG